MNQIYACRKGREIPFNGTTRINTASPATRSDGRNLFVKLLMGVFVFLVLGALNGFGQVTNVYFTPGTYTYIVPPGITSIQFDVTGAGGGGAGSIDGVATGGGGGGGSFQRYTCTVVPGSTVTIVVGNGGVGGGPGAGGASGGVTSITGTSCTITHSGGAGGAITAGGVGDIPTSGNSGGNGGTGYTCGACGGAGPFGAGGGGAATFAANGTPGNNGTPTGGPVPAGGVVGGGTGGGTNGGNATANGGGGGGAGFIPGTAYSGGTGGAGQVIVTTLVGGVAACPTYNAGTYGPFCQTDAPVCLVGTPAGAPGALTVFAGPGVTAVPTATCASGYQFDPALAGPGCHTITYSYTDPNPPNGCAPTNTATTQILVYPTAPVITNPTNVCQGSSATLPTVAPVAGFTTQYSVDGGAYSTAPSTNLANGCHTVTARYVNTAPCGATPALTQGPGTCGTSNTVNFVTFPTAPTIANPANVCTGSSIVNPTVPNQAGFTPQYNVNGAGFTTTPVTPTTPGCYTVTARYVLTAACGAAGPNQIPANTTPPAGCAVSNTANFVVFPTNPTLIAPAPVCEGTQLPTPTGAGAPPAGFVTQYNVDGAGYSSVFPTTSTPGCRDITARYVTAAPCGTIPAGTAGPAGCNGSNSVPSCVVETPVANDPPDMTVCCGTPQNIPFTLSSDPAVPAGGTFNYVVTSSNAAIGAVPANVAGAPGTGDGTLSFTPACNNNTETSTITLTPTYTYVVPGPGGGTVTCSGAPQSFDFTVRPATIGIIQIPANQDICAGQQGNINVFLNGTAPFTGTFNIRNTTTNTSTQYVWTSPVPGGPQNIPIPTAQVPGSQNLPVTYEVTWVSLTDAGPCTALPANLQGQANITVNPTPNLFITRSPSTGNVCPGTAITYTVTADPGPPNGNATPGANTVPATFNYTITGVGFTTQSGSNVAYGTPITITTPGCPINTTLTFTATPNATAAPTFCPGPAETNTVTVSDPNNPVFNTFNNQAFDRCAAGAIATARAANPTATNGGCPSGNAVITGGAETFTPTCGYVNNAGYQAGETGVISRTWTATDPCGNTATLTQTITITDATAPTADQAPGALNRTVEYCDITGPNGYNAANALAPTFSDQCPHPGPGLTVVKTTGVFAVGACPTTGTFTNTWVATDPCGNASAPYTQTITVVDTQGPQFTPAVVPTQTLNVGGAGCQATLPNYIATVPITATDCAAPGVFPAPAAIVNDPGNASGPNRIWQTPAPGITIFGPAGTIIPITITAQDGCGNQRTMSFNVNIVDATPPNAVCRSLNNTTAGQSNSRVVLGSNGQFTITVSSNPAAVQNVNGGSSDNCGGTLTYSFTSMGFAGGVPTNVTPTRTYTCADIPAGQQSAIVNTTMFVMDQYGNQASCVAAVTVIDNTAPVFTNCPANNTLTLVRDAGCTATVPNYMTMLPINATDACGPVTYTQSPLPGSILGAGAPVPNNGQFIDITITATDGRTNSSTCTFRVLLRDQTAPSFGGTCPGNQTVSANAVSCSQTVCWVVPTATDNCAPANNQGAITYTVTATGNNTNPDLSAAQFTTPGSNVCAVFFVGTTTVTYTASDNAFPTPNTSTCTFVITVTDNTNPVITNCSAPLTNTKNVNTGTNNCVYTHSGSAWDITATDNCLLATTPYAYSLSGATTTVGFVNANTLNGVVFNRGTTTVIWRVTDFSGNQATCTFQVIVTDANPPVFGGPNPGSGPATAGCPANQTFVANTAGCVWTVPAGNTALHVNATDNCGITLFEWDISGASPAAAGNQTVPFTGTTTNGTYGIPSGTVFQVGVTNVQYRIRDAQGNIVTCTFTVTVQNNVNGTIGTTTTVAQNAMTTSTITFTGSGSGAAPGTQQYRFFYSLNTNGGGFVAQPPVTTAVGSNVTTVAQSNAATGTFVYRLDQVQDLTTGCMSPANLNQTATITVVVGSELQSNGGWTILTTQNFPSNGTSRDFIYNIFNIGATTSSVPVMVNIPRITGYTLVLPAGPTLGGQAVDNANWTLTTNATFWVLTSNTTIPAGGSSRIGVTITRVSVAPQSQNALTGTLSGGGDQNASNNTSTVVLIAQ